MRLGCFATEVGGQIRGPAESILLMLTVKAPSAEASEPLREAASAP